MNHTEQRDLERLRYRQGQLLRSSDFQRQAEIEDQLRAWHNRALHNAYGIVRGCPTALAVRQSADGLGVVVRHGTAYDSFGRELLLEKSQSVPFAEENRPMLLVIRRRSFERSCVDKPLSCFPVGSSPASETELIWIAVQDFSFEDGVALAKTKVQGGAITLDKAFRTHHSRPLSRPRVATGATIPGLTAWQAWDLTVAEPIRATDLIFRAQVRIDISSAGFTTPPACFASLQGQLFREEPDRLDPLRSTKTFSLYFDHVDEITINSFVFRILIVAFQFGSDRPKIERNIQNFMQEQNAYVSWVAIGIH